MDVKLAAEKARQLKISMLQIVREEYEMILLSRIFESKFGKNLVFRGGTGLRLGYNSPRFSDDLDFSEIQPIKMGEFDAWCREVAKDNEYLDLVEAIKKYFTLFALFRIKDPVLPASISIKIEISARREEWKRNKDYKLMRLYSEVTPVTVIAQVATLARIEKEKLSIKKKRVRDIFDLWFIGQQIKKAYKMDFSKFDSKEVKRELNRLLPRGERELIELWLSKS